MPSSALQDQIVAHPPLLGSRKSADITENPSNEDISINTIREKKLPACAETGNEFVWIYRLQADGPFTLHPEEIERGEWFAPAEVRRWMAERPQDFCASFTLIWRHVSREL